MFLSLLLCHNFNKTMIDKIFTKELEQIFQYIEENLLKEFPTEKITIDYLVLSILENDNSIAYNSLSKLMLNDSINILKEKYYKKITNNIVLFKNNNFIYDKSYEQIINKAKNEINRNHIKFLNSGLILCVLLEEDKIINNDFKEMGVTYTQLYKTVKNETEENNTEEDRPIKHEKKTNNTIKSTSKSVKTDVGETEKNLLNLNNLAINGKIDISYNNDCIYQNVFNTFGKCKKNNVLIVGEDGVGKTTLIKNIANKLIKGEVPNIFKNRILMQLNFNELILGTGIRGLFESKCKNIIDDAKLKNRYIFFIDDIHNLLNNKNNYGDSNIDMLINNILTEKNILFIASITPKGYSNFISNNSFLKQNFNVIKMDEPTIDNTIEILTSSKEKLERFHNIKISKSNIETCVKLCKRYLSERILPEVAIDIIDEIGATYSIKDLKSDKLNELNKELEHCINEKENCKNEKNYYELIDKLTIKEIGLRSKINIEEKRLILSDKKINISNNDVKSLISKKTNIPLSDINVSERERLKNLDSNLKKVVIGQNEAIDEVCRVIKRQRIGLSNINKPSVLFFGGTTGTGKSYLAKKIAEIIFGSEKYLVRLDMSEYSDKMSVNKLYGSAPGYVGYEEGGYLTEAIKKNKYCVLLLDEIEKASEEVHNSFLQLFDEGRMTDNKGVTIDFKNVIIIMTSNVGAKEISLRGKRIGFNETDINFNKDIVEKNLKKHFKPEFLNRIDKIVYFNELSNEMLKDIIKLELDKLERRINEIGYSLDEDLKSETMIELLFNNIKDLKEYGARPILKEIQHTLEDKITDFIIDKNPSKKHNISYSDIF